MIKLSIITINYNDAKGLAYTMQSVLNQSFTDFEYLVIDGGSKDGSSAVIEQYKESLSYWISEPDSGIYNAMNKGLAQVKGSYVLFMNSGDAFNGNTALENIVNHPNFKGDIIYGDYKSEENYSYPDALSPFFFVINSLPHQATFFKKSVFERIGILDESYKISADKEFYVRCLVSDLFVFQHIKQEVSVFDKTGISNTNEPLRRAEDLRLFQKHFGIFYSDYLKMEAQHHQIIYLHHQTIKGIFKRIKRKLNL